MVQRSCGVLFSFWFVLFIFVRPAENRDAEMHVELHSMVLNKERASHTLLYLGNLILFAGLLFDFFDYSCMGLLQSISHASPFAIQIPVKAVNYRYRFYLHLHSYK